MKPVRPTAEEKLRQVRHRLALAAVLWVVAVLSAGLLVLFDVPVPAATQATASAQPVPSR